MRLLYWGSKLPLFVVLALSIALLSACDEEQEECVDDEDCPLNARCIFGSCEPIGTDLGGDSDLQVDLGDVDFDAAGCVPPVSGAELAINEVHAAVLTGEDDTNCDGVSDARQDEFVEIVNPSQKSILLNGVGIDVGGSNKTTLSGCLPPGRGMIVYADGMASCSDLGATQAVVSEKQLTLSNSGTLVELKLGETVLDSATVPDLSSSNSSWSRIPDFTGDFAEHISASDNRFSAGKCLNGEELILGCMPNQTMDGMEMVDTDMTSDSDMSMDMDMEMDVPPPCDPPGNTDIVLNELLSDPPPDPDGDANCDGTRSGTADEFVELVNVSSMQVNLNGIDIEVGGTIEFEFTEDECLNPGQAVVIFGGGNPMCTEFSDVLIKTGGLSLNNGGEEIRVLDSSGMPFALGTTTFAPPGSEDQSFQRSPDLTGDMFSGHGEIPEASGALYSPGTCINGSSFSTGCM